MKKVYVTECGYFDENDRFQSSSIIGVDSMMRLAVSFPISVGCYRHDVVLDSISWIVTYKSCFSNRGYRVTSVDAY